MLIYCNLRHVTHIVEDLARVLRSDCDKGKKPVFNEMLVRNKLK
jgi:hypothetical protein